MNKTAFARGLLVGFALLLLFMIPGFAGGQDKALIEAARKEGKVTIFGSLQDEVMKEIQASFERKYPGVKSVYWRASTTAVMDRAISEFRTGNVSWDVFFTGVDAMEIMKNEGMFLRYQTAASKNFDKSYHHEFYSPNYRSSIIGFVYNTRSIKQAEAPKSYWDYVDPKWDGKTTMSDPTSHSSMAKWLSSLHLVLGDKGKEDEYTHRLAASRPLLHRSLTPAVESIPTARSHSASLTSSMFATWERSARRSTTCACPLIWAKAITSRSPPSRPT